MIKPLVSVCLVTYNQEQFIRNCLESIVSQKTSFDFEIIVYDDASTDSTPEIINEFSKRYSFIRAVLRKINVGAFQNFIDCHSAATSEFVCHCDGDDYWLQNKLEKQVAYMQNNPGCNVLWHRVKFLDSNGNLRDDNLRDEILSLNFSKYDLAALGTIAVHSSKMYRKRQYNYGVKGIPYIDYALNIMDAGDGYAKVLDHDALGVYRLGLGVSSSGMKTKQLYIQCYKTLVKKDKNLKMYCTANALTKLIGALKNARMQEVRIFMPVVMNLSFFSALGYLYKRRNIIKMASLK